MTTNMLLVPPTYFVINHAERLATRHTFEVFALLADIRDSSVTVPIHDFAPFPALARSRRQYLAPFAGRQMTRAIERFSPDVIHQHFATWSGPALVAARRVHAPLLTTVHGYDVRVMTGSNRSPMSLWHRHNVRGIQKAAHRVLAVSRYLADEAIAGGFQPSTLHVHYQGIDTDFFTPSDEDSGRSESPIVAFVGALNAQKGVLDLIEASLQLVAGHDHQLIVVGVGPLEARIREIAVEHPHITVLGSVPREGVREIMRMARVLVLPSQQHNGGREAAGLVLLEAQACGTPVIAYESGGIPEMLVPDTTGVLVPERNLKGLTSAMKDILMLEGSALASMGIAARNFVVEQRSVAHSCLELERHYDDISR